MYMENSNIHLNNNKKHYKDCFILSRLKNAMLFESYVGCKCDHFINTCMNDIVFNWKILTRNLIQ